MRGDKSHSPPLQQALYVVPPGDHTSQLSDWGQPWGRGFVHFHLFWWSSQNPPMTFNYLARQHRLYSLLAQFPCLTFFSEGGGALIFYHACSVIHEQEVVTVSITLLRLQFDTQLLGNEMERLPQQKNGKIASPQKRLCAARSGTFHIWRQPGRCRWCFNGLSCFFFFFPASLRCETRQMISVLRIFKQH